MYTFLVPRYMFTIFICLFTFIVDAQVTMGIRGGYTMSWRANIDWTDEDEYIKQSSFQLSLLSYVDIGKRLSLGMEPGLVQRVSGRTFSTEFFDTDQKFLLNYFELPLMVSAKYPLWSIRWEINVKAGYGLAFLRSAYRVFPSINDDPPEKMRLAFDKNGSFLNQKDHGLYGGVGIAYKIGNSRFFLETDYYLGFQDVIIFGDTSKNRSVHLGTGYKITF